MKARHSGYAGPVKARPSSHPRAGKIHSSEPAHGSANAAKAAKHNAVREQVRETFRQNLPKRHARQIKD